MTAENDVGRCRECGAPSARTGKEALCVACLLRLAVADDTDGEDATLFGEDLPTETLPLDERVLPTEAGDDGPAAGRPFTGPHRIGEYRILRELGTGGMGKVFEAHDEKMQRRVALKILSAQLAPSTLAWHRFEQEAWIGGRLNHPNLVRVYDRGEWEGHAYYTMELVEGGSLYDVVQNMRQWKRDDALGLEFGSKGYTDWVIEQTIAAARALDHAHRQGVVHRDIKPMNLLLGGDPPSVKIADFGLAIDAEGMRVTSSGVVLGTLSYMAPEQLLGKTREIDRTADIYALGVTLFELLTLKLPFRGRTREAYMHSVLTAEPRNARSISQFVSRDLETVVGKAIEKRARDRYASAADLADDLESVLRLRPIRARPPGRLEKIAKWSRRRPAHAALLAVLVLGTPITGVLGYRAVEYLRLVRQQTVAGLETQMREAGQRERFFDLVQTADELIRLVPDHAEAIRSRALGGLELWEQRKPDDPTRDELERDVRADAARLVALLPRASWTHRVQQHVLERLGDEAGASIARNEAVELRDLTNPTTDDLEIEAMLASRSGWFEEAIEIYDELIARNPRLLDAIQRRGELHQDLGRCEKAMIDYGVVLGHNPDSYFARMKLGHCQTLEGELRDGMRNLTRALELRNDDTEVLKLLADNSLKQGREAVGNGDEERALALFRDAEALARRSLPGEDDPETYVALGASLTEQSRLIGHDVDREREAMQSFEAAARIFLEWENDQGYADVRLNQCDTLLLAPNLEEAVPACLEATRLGPAEPIAHYNLAGAYALSGRKDEAFAALERDFELGDTDYGWLEQDDWFRSLRDDPRYVDLIRRMKKAAATSD